MTATLAEQAKKIKPLGDRIVIQKAEAAEKTEGGIYLPSGSQEKPLEGIVVAVGPGSNTDKGEKSPMTVKEGDRVLYSKFAGTDIKVGSEELLIVSEKEVLAIIEQ